MLGVVDVAVDVVVDDVVDDVAPETSLTKLSPETF